MKLLQVGYQVINVCRGIHFVLKNFGSLPFECLADCGSRRGIRSPSTVNDGVPLGTGSINIIEQRRKDWERFIAGSYVDKGAKPLHHA
ncbi:MAG: hypothetical protein KGI46_12450, partial [Alphaproteobacteria bacterium]|nr:hypothetical protein [Alphaproteobacteria bacterium]